MARLNQQDDNSPPPPYEEVILLQPKNENIIRCEIPVNLPSYDEAVNRSVPLNTDRYFVTRNAQDQAILPASSSHASNRKCAIFTIIAMIIVFIIFLVLISLFYIIKK